MENNSAWIRIQFNTDNQYEGSEELVKELKEICPVQVSSKWYPSACTGLELLLTLNFNLSFGAFLNNVLIPGAEFAGVCALARAIWKSFDKFLKRNEAFDFQKLEFNFDDVTLVFLNVMSYGALLKFYKELPEHMDVFNKNGIKNVSLIKLPYIEDPTEEKGKGIFREWTLEDEDKEEIFWKVIYERGLEKCFYNPNNREIVEI